MRPAMVGSIAAMLAAALPLGALRAQNADSASARASDTTASAPAADSAAAPLQDDTTARREAGRRWERRGGRRSIVPGLRIANVEGDGSFITLQDGTQWEVYLPDRPSTATWRQGDFVTVKLRPIAEGRYTYELTDGRTDSDAAVKLRGRARAGR